MQVRRKTGRHRDAGSLRPARLVSGPASCGPASRSSSGSTPEVAIRFVSGPRLRWVGMRISRIKVDRWRNLRDLTIELDPDADFLCLVGENGTGKSHVLDLLHFAAHHLGLIDASTSKRQPPYVTEEPYRVEVTLTLGPEWREYLSQTPDAVGGIYDGWNGELTFESWGDTKDPADSVPAAPNGAGGSSGATYYYWQRVIASGINHPDAGVVGNQVAQRLRAAPEVLHLYIDAERVFPPADVQDQEVLALSRQEFDAPWIRRQAAILTQNLYIEWMRSMLAQQQRMQSDYFQRAQEAKRNGEGIPEPEDFLDDYRAALLQVLPHLEFVRLDHESRRLIYNSAGVELPYEDLSAASVSLRFSLDKSRGSGFGGDCFSSMSQSCT
jgi:hypothetical protein